MAEAADEDIQVEEAPQKGGLGKWIIMAAMIVAAAAAGIPLVAYRNRALQAWRHIDSLDEISGLLDIAGAA